MLTPSPGASPALDPELFPVENGSLEALELVRRSPEFVAASDRTGWLGLFTPDAVVRDPVNAAPHRRDPPAYLRGDDPLERFWNTFIAANAIRFEVRCDVVSGGEVVRDVDIHTRLSTGLSLVVPTHLRYRTRREAAGLRITALDAHWELPGMVTQVLGAGLLGARTMTAISGRMFEHQGVAGVVGYSGGFVPGPAWSRRRRLAEFVKALADNRPDRCRGYFGKKTPVIHWPPGRERDPEGLCRALREAGAALTGNKFVCAGHWGSGSLELRVRGALRRGVFFARFAPASAQLDRVDVYVAPPSE